MTQTAPPARPAANVLDAAAPQTADTHDQATLHNTPKTEPPLSLSLQASRMSKRPTTIPQTTAAQKRPPSASQRPATQNRPLPNPQTEPSLSLSLQAKRMPGQPHVAKATAAS